MGKLGARHVENLKTRSPASNTVSLSSRRRWNVNGSNPLDVLTQLRWILAPLPANPPFPFFPSRSMTLQAYYRQIVNVESFVAFPFSDTEEEEVEC